MKKTIPIFFAVDDGYAPYLSVALKSLTDNCNTDYFCDIYILTESLSDQNRQKLSAGSGERFSVTFVNVKEKLDAIGRLFHLRDYYSLATYFRFFIPDLFPQFGKGIYLDCDIWVGGDISKLFEIPIGGNLIGAVADDIVKNCRAFGNYTETVLGIPRNRYFSAGVLLMNLTEMRRFGMESAFAELRGIRTYRVAQDQDYLNVICRDRVVFLNRKWNFTAYPGIDDRRRVGIVHYKINFKPWHYSGIGYEKQFWETAAVTPYYAEIRKTLSEYTADERLRDDKQLIALRMLAQSETDEAVSGIGKMTADIAAGN